MAPSAGDLDPPSSPPPIPPPVSSSGDLSPPASATGDLNPPIPPPSIPLSSGQDPPSLPPIPPPSTPSHRQRTSRRPPPRKSSMHNPPPQHTAPPSRAPPSCSSPSSSQHPQDSPPPRPLHQPPGWQQRGSPAHYWPHAPSSPPSLRRFLEDGFRSFLMESSYSACVDGPRHLSWKRRRLVPNLTKPVRFVSIGTAMPNPNLNRAAAPSTPIDAAAPSTQIDAAAPSTQIDTADFDKYGSFALNMMSKMSFKTGSGLGKHEQGIVAFIEPNPRPRNLGMGFHGLENKKKAVRRRRGGKNQGKNRKRKARATEIACNVFDIMPPQLPNAKEMLMVISDKEFVEDDDEDMSQDDIAEIKILRVDLDEDVVEDGALAVDVDTDTAKDDVSRKREREKLVCLENEKFCGGVGVKEIIDSGLERMQDDLLSGALTLDSMLETLKHLKEMFEEEYKLCNLSIMALSYAYPLLVEVFVGWEPLQNPMHGLELMLSWRDLLLDVDTRDNVAGSSLFELLVSEVVLPAMLVSVTNTWQVCEPEPMIRFLESWDALLPAQVRQSILDDIVMPKLSAAVESWNAMPKTIPIDAWIHPWLPLLGQRLELFYDKICF